MTLLMYDEIVKPEKPAADVKRVLLAWRARPLRAAEYLEERCDVIHRTTDFLQRPWEAQIYVGNPVWLKVRVSKI